MLSTTSSGRNPAAQIAGAIRQKSRQSPSGSVIGPGDRYNRRSDPAGTASIPPNGGSAACRVGRSSLGNTGMDARSATLATSPGETPAPASRRSISRLRMAPYRTASSASRSWTAAQSAGASQSGS